MKSKKLFIPLLGTAVLILSLAAVGLISYLRRGLQATTAIPEISMQEINVEPTSFVQANECLACHTEKKKLIDTAKPEEVVVKGRHARRDCEERSRSRYPAEAARRSGVAAGAFSGRGARSDRLPGMPRRCELTRQGHRPYRFGHRSKRTAL